jgi:hypothetical protein
MKCNKPTERMWKYKRRKNVRVWLSGSAVDICTAVRGINRYGRKNEKIVW